MYLFRSLYMHMYMHFYAEVCSWPVNNKYGTVVPPYSCAVLQFFDPLD